MPELTLEEALKSTSAWTDEEINWIYSVGGSVYGDIETETEHQADAAGEALADAYDEPFNWADERVDMLKSLFVLTYGEAFNWADERVDMLKSLIADAYDGAFDLAEGGVDMLTWLTQQALEEATEETDSLIDKAAEAAKNAGQAAATWIDERFGDITINLDFGFEWLAARLEDLLEIPAMAFFKYLSFLTQPPGAEEG